MTVLTLNPKDLKASHMLGLSAASVLISIQLVMVLLWLSRYFPNVPDAAAFTFPEAAARAGHTGASFWVVIFSLAGIAVHGFCVVLMRARLGDQGMIRGLKSFLLIESILTALLLSAFFKVIVYDDRPILATWIFWALTALTALNKIFWPEIKTIFVKSDALIRRLAKAKYFPPIFAAVFAAFTALLIYVPNPEGALARIFIGEQFHHWDSFVMGPGMAYSTGSVLNVEVVSRYGLGMPIIVSHLTKIFGGFTHLNVLIVLIAVCIAYYVLWYLLLSRWLGVFIAAIVILVAVRTQMFHTGTYPFVFTYPSATPMRFCFDILFMASVFGHLVSHRRIFLLGAGLFAGAGIFHLTAEGLYLTAALYFYLLAHVLTPHYRRYVCSSAKDIVFIVGCFVMPVVVAAGLFYAAQGTHMFRAEFWKNMTDFAMFFLSGFGTNPIYQSLQSRLYLQSLMGFVMPLGYVFSLVLLTSLWCLRKLTYRDIFAAVLCVYGLGLYHYYISLSMWTSYYMIGLPFWFVMGYWLKTLTSRLPARQAYNTKLVLFTCAFLALMTNHNFLSYPNALNVSRNPLVDPLVAQPLPNRMPYFNHLFYQYPDAYKMPLNSVGETDEQLKMEPDFRTDSQLVEYFRQEFDFDEDAKLIQNLTPSKSRVALVSSFEIKILMQADRQPFFYVFPLVNSRPMRMRNFVVTHLYTVDHLKRTLAQLEDNKPEYVFMERIFLNRTIPQAYIYDSPGLLDVLNYINDGYEPVSYGKYLVAMKRKASS